jgi:hypothetical protein
VSGHQLTDSCFLLAHELHTERGLVARLNTKVQGPARPCTTHPYQWLLADWCASRRHADPFCFHAHREAFNTSNSAAAYNLILVTLQYKYMM